MSTIAIVFGISNVICNLSSKIVQKNDLNFWKFDVDTI